MSFCINLKKPSMTLSEDFLYFHNNGITNKLLKINIKVTQKVKQREKKMGTSRKVRREGV